MKFGDKISAKNICRHSTIMSEIIEDYASILSSLSLLEESAANKKHALKAAQNDLAHVSEQRAQGSVFFPAHVLAGLGD
jgi:hypothetical protein